MNNYKHTINIPFLFIEIPNNSNPIELNNIPLYYWSKNQKTPILFTPKKLEDIQLILLNTGDNLTHYLWANGIKPSSIFNDINSFNKWLKENKKNE